MTSIGDSSTSVYRAAFVSFFLTLEETDTHPVDLDDAHIMAVDPEEERRERRDVDHAQAIRLARLEGQRRVLIEPAQVRRVLREVDQAGVWHGLGTAGVRDAEEVVRERRVLVVVPVGEDDSELGVVAVHFGGRVQEEGRAQAVGVLALFGVRLTCKRG